VKKSIAGLIFVSAWAINPISGAAMHKFECLPQYRVDVDTQTVLNYQGSMRQSAPLTIDNCERREGLIVANSSYMDYFGMVHYVPLSYVTDKGEPDSKFDGFVYPLDITAEIEEDVRHEDYRYAWFIGVKVNVRQKRGESIWFDESSTPLLLMADKRTISLISKGGGHGGASFGASMQLGFELPPKNISELLNAKKYSLIVPFTRRREKAIEGKFTLRLNLTSEGAAEFKKFLKVALKHVETNQILDIKHKDKK